jgi:iron(III) transport system substrate-binding protein
MKSVPRGAHARNGRRLIRLAAVFGVAVSMALTACGSGGSTEPGANNTVKTGEAPEYYPAAYTDVIAASKSEGGTMTIYSNTDQENWDPIFRDFKKKYPWVTEISANNLDSDEVFQRVFSEQATAGSPADIVVSNAAQAWADFGARQGTLMAYSSPEVAKLP